MRATIQQMFELNNNLRSGRISGEALQRLIENPDHYNDKLGRFGRRYDLAVNYDLGVDRLVVANKFDYNNDDVTSAHFPVEHNGIRPVTVELYEFDRTVIGEDAFAQIEDDGYVNEDVPTLLTFGKENPIEQLRRPIIALSSRWQCSDNSWRLPGLGRHGDKRGLGTVRLQGRFDPDFCFLVSRK